MDKHLYHFIVIIVIVTSFTHPPTTSGNEIQITATLGLQAEYNDNIFFSDTDALDDTIATISPKLSYTQDSERFNLEVAGQIDSINYEDNDELNDIDQNISSAIRYRPYSRMQISGEFDYFKDSRPDRDIETTGLLLSSNIRYSRFFTLNQTYEHSENTVSSLTYTFENQDFEDPQLVDFDTHIARLVLSHNIHRFFPRTLARMNLGYIRYTYPQLKVDYSSIILGANHDITELWTLSMDFGTSYTRKKTEPGTVPVTTVDESERESGITGALGISHQDEFTKILFAFSHELRAASGRSAITERTSLLFDIGRKMTAELKTAFKVRYYINRADQGDLATEDIDTRTLSIIPGISYEITDDILFEAFYNYSKIEDRQDDADATRNLFVVRLVGHHPFLE